MNQGAFLIMTRELYDDPGMREEYLADSAANFEAAFAREGISVETPPHIEFEDFEIPRTPGWRGRILRSHRGARNLVKARLTWQAN